MKIVKRIVKKSQHSAMAAGGWSRKKLTHVQEILRGQGDGALLGEEPAETPPPFPEAPQWGDAQEAANDGALIRRRAWQVDLLQSSAFFFGAYCALYGGGGGWR